MGLFDKVFGGRGNRKEANKEEKPEEKAANTHKEEPEIPLGGLSSAIPGYLSEPEKKATQEIQREASEAAERYKGQAIKEEQRMSGTAATMDARRNAEEARRAGTATNSIIQGFAANELGSSPTTETDAFQQTAYGRVMKDILRRKHLNEKVFKGVIEVVLEGDSKTVMDNAKVYSEEKKVSAGENTIFFPYLIIMEKMGHEVGDEKLQVPKDVEKSYLEFKSKTGKEDRLTEAMTVLIGTGLVSEEANNKERTDSIPTEAGYLYSMFPEGYNLHRLKEVHTKALLEASEFKDRFEKVGNSHDIGRTAEKGSGVSLGEVKGLVGRNRRDR